MARKVKKRLPTATKSRLGRLADGLTAVIDELEQDGTRVAVVPEARDFIEVLRQHVGGNSAPLERMLGLTNGPGSPGFDKATKLDILRQLRVLRARGLSRDSAISALRVNGKPISVDQRTITKWKSTAVGVAEEIEARLNVQDGQVDS